MAFFSEFPIELSYIAFFLLIVWYLICEWFESKTGRSHTRWLTFVWGPLGTIVSCLLILAEKQKSTTKTGVVEGVVENVIEVIE